MNIKIEWRSTANQRLLVDLLGDGELPESGTIRIPLVPRLRLAIATLVVRHGTVAPLFFASASKSFHLSLDLPDHAVDIDGDVRMEVVAQAANDLILAAADPVLADLDDLETLADLFDRLRPTQ